MDPYTGNSASGAGPKKDKKSKKNYEDGDGKKKFVSIHVFKGVAVWARGLLNAAPIPCTGHTSLLFQVKLKSNNLLSYLWLLLPPKAARQQAQSLQSYQIEFITGANACQRMREYLPIQLSRHILTWRCAA